MEKESQEVTVTSREWYLMDCLWASSPKTLMQLVAELKMRIGWSKSTCATMVRRMTEKGLIAYKEEGKTKFFYPLLEKEKVAKKETRAFIQRIYDGSIGMMMSALAEDGLSRQDIQELKKLIEQYEKEETGENL